VAQIEALGFNQEEFRSYSCLRRLR